MGKTYKDSDGNDCTIHQMIKREPYWAAERIQQGERAIEELEKIKQPSLFKKMAKGMKSMTEIEAKALHEAFMASLIEEPEFPIEDKKESFTESGERLYK